MTYHSNIRGYIELPRGGYLMDTSIGFIQVGSPPETIKDTMKLEKKTPLIFILPSKLFHVDKGISVAELEFPLYYNFFLRQKRTTIVCTEKQRSQLTVVLNESVFGPENINLENEFFHGAKTFGFPLMKKEMAFFKGNKKLSDLIEFKVFENDQVLLDKDVRIINEGIEFFLIDGHKKIRVPAEVGFKIKYDIGERLKEPFQAPLLGITCLGPSHGFDPDDNTSGFIIWINHKGIMVDPPVNSTEWLRESNVNPKLINHVILTHCHADHDAGTFQKILEESKITIHSTPTIMESFLRKYCSLTQISRKEIINLFNFHPVIIGKPSYINGAEFNFYYSLHAIPAMGFEFFFQDQSFVYSSDHLNDPETFDKLYEQGIFTESRYTFLKEFPWSRNIIYHEAGVPPIHTKITYLASLPEEVQKKITVYHISKKDMIKDSGLALAKFGIENTLYPKITPPKHIAAYNLLDIMGHIDIFNGYPIEKAKEFLLIATEEQYKRGDLIIKKGTMGDKFYIIAYGTVKFEGLTANGELQPTKRFETYEYFGEASLILNIPRQSDVYAETDVSAVTIEKDKFLQFIRGSDLVRNLEQLNSIRETNSWKTLNNSKHFSNLSSYQKTQLELMMKLVEFPKGHEIIREGEWFHAVYVLRTGEIATYKIEIRYDNLIEGDVVGEMYNIYNNLPSNYSFIADTEVTLYKIEREELIDYIKKNPVVYMKMNAVYSNE